MTRLLPQFAELTLAPDAPVDFHMHTTYSDGRWPAQQLVDYLVHEGFQLVSVTDHDRVDKVAEIQHMAAAQQLPVLSGVELTTRWREHMAHMLCYGFDPEQNELGPLTENVVRLQLENTHEVYAELQRRGYTFPRQAEILAENGGKLNRPIDNAILLHRHGHVPDMHTAMQTITEAGFRSIKVDMAEAVEAAHRSGAVCLIAHGGRRERNFTYYDTTMLDQLRAEIPIDGLEVYHPYHDKETVQTYLDYVHKHNLLYSTGSDSHATTQRMPTKHKAEVSQKLLERMGVSIR